MARLMSPGVTPGPLGLSSLEVNWHCPCGEKTAAVISTQETEGTTSSPATVSDILQLFKCCLPILWQHLLRTWTILATLNKTLRLQDAC